MGGFMRAARTSWSAWICVNRNALQTISIVRAKAAECAALQTLRAVQSAGKIAPAFGVRRIPPLLLCRSLAGSELARRCNLARSSQPAHLGCYRVMTAVIERSATPKVTATSSRLLPLDALRGFDMFWIMGGDMLLRSLPKIHNSPLTQFFANQMEHC